MDGAYTFTGAPTSYKTATSRTGIVGGGLGFTLCAWVYRTQAGRAWDRLIDFGNGGELDSANINVAFTSFNPELQTELRSGMSFAVKYGSDASFLEARVSSAIFPANVWTHVAVVQSRANLTDTNGPAQIYWNGVSVATTATFRFPLPVSRANLYVGKSNWGDHDPLFTGQMKDLLVWDVALSPAELDAVRRGGVTPSTPAPLISMMRTWCGAAPPSPPSPPSQPPCAVDGAYTFTGAPNSYLTATSRTGLVGGGLGLTLCAWVKRTRGDRAFDRLIDFGNGGPYESTNFNVAFSGGDNRGMTLDIRQANSLSYIRASRETFPADVWTHVAVVQSRASLTDTDGPVQIYWNGESVAMTPTTEVYSNGWANPATTTTATMRFPLPVSRSNLYVGKSNWGVMTRCSRAR